MHEGRKRKGEEKKTSFLGWQLRASMALLRWNDPTLLILDDLNTPYKTM